MSGSANMAKHSRKLARIASFVTCCVIGAQIHFLPIAHAFGVPPSPIHVHNARHYFKSGVSFRGNPLLSSLLPRSRLHQPLATKMLLGSQGLSTGLKAARYILDSKERQQLKSLVQSRFPVIPGSLVDSAIDEVADLVRDAAPNDLKLLLSPGGLGGEREKLRDKYARQLAAKVDVPMLNEAEEAKLFAFFIDKIFDELMAADEDFFTAPIDRLVALEESIVEVRREVHFLSLLLYRARRNALKLFLAAAAVTLFFLLPNIYSHFPLAKVWAAKVVTVTSNLFSNLLLLYFRLPFSA